MTKKKKLRIAIIVGVVVILIACCRLTVCQGPKIGRIRKATVIPTETVPPVTETPTVTLAQTESPAPTETPNLVPPTEATSASLEVWPCPDNTIGARYVGSADSDKFHHLECRWAEKILSENRICFASREAAVGYGYQPCGTCKP